MTIVLFVASGFEHSVANMFLIPLGIVISHAASGAFWADIGVAQESPSATSSAAE